MATLSTLLARAAVPPSEAPAPRGHVMSSMPVRLPGGARLGAALADEVPVAPPPMRVLGGRAPPAPRIPGGVPGRPKTPPIPPAPTVPTPDPAALAMAGRKAPRVVRMPPSAFADTFGKKPTVVVEIGVRLLADGDLDKARAAAARSAELNHPTNDDVRVEAYNEALMQWVVARGTCQPLDVRAAYWDTPQDTVPIALTDDGLKLLFHEITNLKIEMSPLQGEATAAEIETLRRLLAIPEVVTILLERGDPRLRRHVSWILEELLRLVGPGPAATALRPEEEIDPSSLPTGPVGG